MTDKIDIRLLQLPDRMEVIRNMDEKTRGTPLSSMQFWEVEDGPVVIMRDGSAIIFCNGAWGGMDPWEAVFEGRPLSFVEFVQRWPSLVSKTDFLESFANDPHESTIQDSKVGFAKPKAEPKTSSTMPYKLSPNAIDVTSQNRGIIYGFGSPPSLKPSPSGKK